MLTISSKDVIHSFWVPEFGQKQDAVPGLHTTLHITPDRIGTYPVICVELCGLGHSMMRSEAIVMTPAGSTMAREPVVGDHVSERRRLRAPPCSRTTAAAPVTRSPPPPPTGKVGPDLDKLQQWAAQAKQPLDSSAKTSITDPNAYIQPGYPKSVMPPTFGSSLSKQQLDALVQYLISSSKKG